MAKTGTPAVASQPAAADSSGKQQAKAAPRLTSERRPSITSSSSLQQLNKLFDDDVFHILLAQPAKDKTAFEKYLKDLTSSQAPLPLTSVFNQPRQSLGGKTLLELLCITGRLDHVRALYSFLGEQSFKDACSRQLPLPPTPVIDGSPSKLRTASADHKSQSKIDAPLQQTQPVTAETAATTAPSSYTVAHFAAGWGQLAILEFLSSNTAVDLLSRACPPRSETPADIAKRNNHTHIVNIYAWLSGRQLLLFACRDAKAVLTSLEHEAKSSKAPDKREREHYNAQLDDFVETVRDDNAIKTMSVEEDIPRIAAQIKTVRFAIDELALRLRTSNPAGAGRASVGGENMLGLTGGGGGRKASTTKGVRGSSLGGGAAKSKKNKK